MNETRNERYALIRWQNQEKLFLPVIGRRLLRAGLAVHQPPSVKGRLFHKLLESGAFFKILRRSSVVEFKTPNRFGGFEWEDWKNHALRAIGIESGWAAFAFPKNEDRRCVALLIDREGHTPRGFAKIGLDEKTRRLFQNEANALMYLARNAPLQASVPELLYESEWNGAYYLVQTVIPLERRYLSNPANAKWIHIINEIANLKSAQRPLREFPWWQQLKTSPTPIKKLLPILEKQCQQNTAVCNAHGDFGPGNTFADREKFWIFDWEEFATNAPIMTDCFSYVIHCFLERRWRVPSNRLLAKRIIDYVQAHCEHANRDNLAIALAYLSTRRSWTIKQEFCDALCEELLTR
jgi:hypothetical protein